MSLNLFDLHGKIAVVTGASRGLGQYFGRALALAGADLVITSRTSESLLEFTKEIVLYYNKEWVDYLVDRIPLKRAGQPNDLDGAVVFLASDASAYMTGQTLLVDGGISTGATKATV